MQTPTEVRYEAVYRMAAEFIVSQGITQLPAEPFRIISANKWGIVSYEQLAKRAGVTVPDIIEVLKSPDGSTSYNHHNYCIAFNTRQRVFPRIRFTLFHEIGHIYLKHFVEYDIKNLTKAQYEILEVEADFFASNVIAPSIIIDQCGLLKPQALCCACGMSKQAANTRLRQFKNWQFRDSDSIVQEVMQEYIHLAKPARLNLSSVDIAVDELTV
jgi:Zn-dependent peptidase ImmA (M78 family)